MNAEPDNHERRSRDTRPLPPWRGIHPATACKAALFLLALVALVAYETLSLDGLNGLLSAWKDNTVYAAGYSNRAFRWVRPGMGVEEVRGLLGDPVGCWIRLRDAHGRFLPGSSKWLPWSRECADEIAADPARLEVLCYTDSNPHDSSFRRRDVHLENGTVVRTFTEYYGD